MRKGCKMSEEIKQKIRDARVNQSPPVPKGTKLSMEHRMAISKAKLGKKFTEEHKVNLSKNSAHYFKDKKRPEFTESHRNKIREYVINNPPKVFKDTKIEEMNNKIRF